MYWGDTRIMQSHTAGLAQLRDDWEIPDPSVSSPGKLQLQAAVRISNGTGKVRFLAVPISKARPSSTQSSKRTALGNLNQLISQSSSWTNKSVWSLNTPRSP